MGEDALLLNAFKAANDVLHGAVQGIAELITKQGMINVDFADVRTVMSEMGTAVMGAGRSCGEDRAMMAVQQAIGSPLLEDINLNGARGVLVNITAGMNLTMKEFEEVGTQIADLASEDATVVVGTIIDPDIGDELRVTVVATGLGDQVARPAVEEPPLTVVRNGSTGQAEPTMGMEPMGELPAEPQPPAPEMDDMFNGQGDIGYLDIPTFLRKQAD